jgi:hypothetical protein
LNRLSTFRQPIREDQVSNPTLSLHAPRSGRQSLAGRFRQILAAVERSQKAKADRVIRRFSYPGARIPDVGSNDTKVNNVVPHRPLRGETAQ